MVITDWVVINKEEAARNNAVSAALSGKGIHTPEQFYEHLQCNYPKFFKMDKLCKWATVGAQYLFDHKDTLYAGTDKDKVALVLATAHGCLDVDKRYMETMSVPSPALFVYTLPNIMLGEICIRYGFRGEQLCMVSEGFDAQELYFNAHDLITNKGMEKCLCGWVDTNEDTYDVCLFWISKNGAGISCTPAVMQELYNRSAKKTVLQ
jgi:hypothetical protein